MTSIMCPTRSRTSQPVQRVITFQFLGSSTSRMKLARSRRITPMTWSLDSAANGLTGAIVAIRSYPSSAIGDLFLGAARRGRRNDDRRQVEPDALPAALVLRRQLKGRAQPLGRLIDREAGAIGSDLEEHAARLAEVNGAEVLAVDDRCHVQSLVDDHSAPGQLMIVVESPPGDVVDR